MPPTKQVNVRLDHDTIKRLEQLATELQISQAAVIKLAIRRMYRAEIASGRKP